MDLEKLRGWITILGLGGMVGTVLALIVKAVIERKSWEFKQHWQEEQELRKRRVDTDRATYNQRLTILVREHLAAFVRSGDWPTDEEDLRNLLLSLAQGTYEHFLDPAVNRAWETLVSKSVELAIRRLAGAFSEPDIWEYNHVRTEWEDACKRSFGPLPATPGALTPRHTPHDFDSTPK